MGVTREFDATAGTVQLLHKGWAITPKMKMDDPKVLLEELSKAVNEAYNKLRDAGVE